jgi:hypothetical protein
VTGARNACEYQYPESAPNPEEDRLPSHTEVTDQSHHDHTTHDQWPDEAEEKHDQEEDRYSNILLSSDLGVAKSYLCYLSGTARAGLAIIDMLLPPARWSTADH